MKDRSLRRPTICALDCSQRLPILIFHKIKLKKFLFFSQTILINFGTLILALLRINIKCYMRFLSVGNEVIGVVKNNCVSASENDNFRSKKE
jgi:hypothetical protein